MIEETGVVVSVEGEVAKVETRRQGACGSCSANGSCGTSLLAQYLGRRPLLLHAQNRAGAAPGDRVVVGVPEEGLIWASVAAYLVPLLGLMAGGMVGASLLPGMKEAASTIGGLAGLVLGLLWMSRFGRTHAQDPRYRAVVLRRVPGLTVGVPFSAARAGDDGAGGTDLIA
jgi:sigma-E factor negative regulatory protein RseC